MSQDLVSLIERGRLGGVRVRILDGLAQQIGSDLSVTLRWRGGDIDRLLDEGHAVLLGRAAASLETAGWTVMPEVTFAIYADRGSIDILAWHPPTSTVLVVEVKTQLVSIEETLRTHDMKARVAIRVARERSGWPGRVVARMLVLPDSSTPRRRVARHSSLLARPSPLAGVAARTWLRAPSDATGLLLFLPFTNVVRGRCGPVSRRRVRKRHAEPNTFTPNVGEPAGPQPGASSRTLHEARS